MVAGIYGYYDTIREEIVYVGQSTDIDERHRSHLKPCRYDEQPFHRILQNNPNRYELRYLKTGDFSPKLMNFLEILYIRRYNTFNDPNKFNYRIGGGRSVLSGKSREKIRETLTGFRHNITARKNMCRSKNSSGYYDVYIQNKADTKQGFIWRYRYTDNGKRIVMSSVDLLKLKQKVLDKGLVWAIVDETKAKITCEKYNYDFVKTI